MSQADPPPQRPGPQAAPTVYSCRRSAFGNEAGWTLGPNALVRAEAGQAAQHVPYGDVEELRLRFDPVRFDRRRYRCDIRRKDGRRLTVRSTSYVSFGTFEDRGERYAPFVRALVARVAEAAPACRFRTGKPPVAYWLRHIAALAALMLLAAAVAVVAELPPNFSAALKLGMIALYVPVAWRLAGRDLPRTFAAERIPAGVLP
jgi:hypothetical protein